MSAAGSYNTFMEAADIFVSLGGYLDAAEKPNDCRKIAQQVKAELEAQQKEQRRAGIYHVQKTGWKQVIISKPFSILQRIITFAVHA